MSSFDAMTYQDWGNSYLGKLRRLVGDMKLINVAVRAIILDEEGRILFIQRKDNKRWVLPSGSLEIDESITDALKREVLEETGLIVKSYELISVYSHPKYSYISHGYEYQMVTFVFKITDWDGTLIKETDETLNARFLPLEDLKEFDIPPLYLETINDLRDYELTGKVIIK
ncbi:NUDIX domain-containing protein [bacterium]|nr:NUDIX domain-containing protein [bacterium]